MADDDPLANLRKPTEEARVDLEHMPDAESGPSEDAPGFVVAGTNPVDLDGVAVDLFELPAFDWGMTPWPNQALRVRAVVDAAGEVVANLAWEAPETDSPDVCVYRVLFRDGDRPDDECTDVQGTLTLTCGLGAEDAAAVNPPESAVRFYEVWCYRGVSTQAALKSSPYPLAAAALVWPPSGVDLSFDHGQIVAAWRDVPDASQQFRWAKQSTQTARGYIPTPDECETAPGGGFVDWDVQPGQKYVYTIYAGGEIDGHLEWSVPVRRQAKAPAALRPVGDLRVIRQEGRYAVDLCWTRIPGVDVRIYRSQARPTVGSHEVGVIPAADLASETELREQDCLKRRPSYEGDVGWIRDVAIPEDCAQLFFTPVTVFEDKCAPGVPREILNLRPPVEPYVEDRVERILVIFEWPQGASDVCLYVSAPGQTIDPATYPQLDRISHEDHRTFGGFRVEREKFKAGTCELHLAACKFGKEARFSEPVSVQHSFPTMLRYRIETSAGIRRTKRTLTIEAQEDIREADLMLAWHPTLLPLTPADREQVLRKWRLELRRGQPESVQLEDFPGPGFVRLLARPGKPIAVIDPPVGQLLIPKREDR